jgi:hypothetical protein
MLRIGRGSDTGKTRNKDAVVLSDHDRCLRRGQIDYVLIHHAMFNVDNIETRMGG